MPGIETTEFLLSKIDDFGTPERLQPLRGRLGARDVHAVSVDQAGRLALGRHPQRHHRALAERLRRPRARSATSSTTSSTSRRPSWRPPGCPSRRWSTASPQAPLEGVSMLPTLARRRRARDATTVQYFEMFGNRGIYHKGWTAVTKHRTPWMTDQPPALRRRRLGAVRARRLDAGARPRRGEPGEAGRAAAALADRGGQVQRGAARRPHLRALQPRHRRAAAADHGQHARLLFPGMRVSENCVLNLKNKSHSVTAEAHGARRRRRRA